MDNKSNAAQADNTAEVEAPAAEDRFANLPTVTLNDVVVPDMSELAISDPRKYRKISDAAIAGRLPTKSGWKHGGAMFVPGTNKKEFRAGSVFGTLQDIVNRAGKSGIASYELATQLRQRQLGNKRSHYCAELPPVGWAEGYIDSAVTQNLVGTHATKRAPALVAPAPAASEDGDKKTA